jgi:Reverse transcriptase (RNA-dependent DNA polymerase)
MNSMHATSKPFNIDKRLVYEAYKAVKSNRGAAGVDEQTIEQFEADLSGNLYKIWNRMSSGSYFPPPVRAVPIPKKSGGERILGVPTVADRVAQMVVKQVIEPILEPIFLADSYGYRPNKSALDAVGATRARCWKYDWVLEFDIKGLFDNIDHELLLRAVRKHITCKWALIYIERWLKAPMVKEDGTTIERNCGTPQGGVVSPILANLFLHYGAPGQTWCFQRVKFPPRQEVQPPHRESSLGSEETTNRTKRRQSDERAVTKVKRLSLVKYLTAGRQHRSGWKAPVGAPQMARWPETAAGSVSTARSDREASRDLGDPLRSWSVHKTDRVCQTIGIIPEKGRCHSAKSDSLVVLGARESRVQGEAAKQMKPDFRETSPAPTEAGV